MALSKEEKKEREDAKKAAIQEENRRSLYLIGQDFKAVEQLLMEVGGDVTEEAACEAIDKFLFENRENLAKKVDGYAMVIRDKTAMAKAKRVVAAAYEDEARSLEKGVELLKKRLLLFMQDNELPYLEGNVTRVAVTANGGDPPIIYAENADPQYAPDDFKTVTVDWNRDTILARLKAGLSLPFAKLGDRGFHARFK